MKLKSFRMAGDDGNRGEYRIETDDGRDLTFFVYHEDLARCVAIWRGSIWPCSLPGIFTKHVVGRMAAVRPEITLPDATWEWGPEELEAASDG